MLIQKTFKAVFFLIFAVIFGMIFGSCDALDFLFPSAGNYKVIVLVNDVPLDDCSFARAEDKIRPYFEESVSEDPDISSLMIFLRDSRGEVVGERTVYCLDNDEAQEGDYYIPVQSLDGDLPEFTLPGDLRMGRYTIVTQVMGGRNILQRVEKEIYYLGRNHFSYDGINVYLPGVAESSHLIPRDAVIMLEANIDFSSNLDPYIVWYEGRKKIFEGKVSEGAGRQFWKAPEQSGFFSLHAEVYPVDNFDGLVGYQKGISILVSSMDVDVHLISNNISQLVHWYTFEGNLYDSKTTAAADRSIVPVSGNDFRWMGANGTYGFVTGSDNIMRLPKIPVKNDAVETWQVLFRSMPINDGDFFTVQLGASNNANMKFSMHENNLILTLTSAVESVSQVFELPQVSEDTDENGFLTSGITFTIQPGSISASINIFGKNINNELASHPIFLDVKIENEFQIILGVINENAMFPKEIIEESENLSTVLWDEFALYYMLPMEILAAELNPVIAEDDELQNE